MTDELPDDELPDDELLRLADQARALQANPAWVLALDRIENDLILTWKRTSPHRSESDTRESCHSLIKRVGLLRDILNEYVQTGELRRQTNAWIAENPGDS